MKKLFLALAILLAAQSAVKASHVLGGEIRWDCLPNGRFIFYAKVFRDCTGITYPFDNKTLEIVGNPLPRSTTNATIRQITLKPDSNKWIANRYGDTSPTCRPGGETITCGDGDEGAVQQFFFVSDPIQLRGTPPSGGWKFYLVQPCCRPNVTNLAAGGTMMLRATMYPDANSTPVDQCHDSSPEFLALPTNMLCRGYEFTYNHTAIDRDLDSLVYAWDRTYNSPPTAPQPVPYAPNYNFNNPTPDKTFSTLNIPADLDPLTGQIKMGVWSGSPNTLDYLTVVRVDAWRGGTVIASVFREIPFVFFDCPRLPSGQINRPPEIFIDGDSAAGIVVDIVANQTVKIPFQAVDNDLTGGIPPLQRITVTPDGYMFSKDLRDTADCYYRPPPGEAQSCAIVRNQNPVFNSVAEPPRHEISGFAGIATEFVWATKCHHIGVSTGLPGTNIGIYNFVMRTFDDHCPIPGINYPTITVRVRDPLPLTQPIMKGVSVRLDGSVKYQWTPPLDTATAFYEYNVEFSQPNDGFPATTYQVLNASEKRYRKDRITSDLRVYRPRLANANEPNVLAPIANKDFYIRMRTMSGCTEDIPSSWSQPARVIELDVVPSGNVPAAPARSEATLTWNAPKASNSLSYPYFIYESRTKYYIWTNDNFTVNTNETYPGLDDPSNWLLRGDTYGLTYEVGSTTCSGDIAFRVEARDTVVTYKQGTRPRLNGTPDPTWLDTLVFSTFSVLDTMYMKNPGFIPPPKFDTVEVRENGDIYMRVDAGNAGTTGEYRLYQNSVAASNLIGTIVTPDDSILISGLNGQVNPLDIIIQGVDDCDTLNKELSDVYETFIPTGQFPTDPCLPTYNLRWINPTGFPNGVQAFRVYQREKSPTMSQFSNWELLKTVPDSFTSVIAKSQYQYKFKIVAFDDEGAVIISAEHPVTVPTKRTYEVVPAPELRCAYVNDDGTVDLNFLPADPSRDPSIDSTGNWVSYQFQYRINGGNWTTFPGSAILQQDTDFVQITGINAITDPIDFRATSLSGCTGSEAAAYSTINLIQPTATAIQGDSNKKVSISWTGSGVFSDEPEFLYKGPEPDFAQDTGYFNALSSIARVENSSPKSFIDAGNGAICDSVITYFVTKMDQLTGCVNRSRPDTARVIDQIPPPPQKLVYVTYEMPLLGQNNQGQDVFLPQGNIEMAWTEKPSDDTEELIIFAPNETTGQNDEIERIPWVGLNNNRRYTISRNDYNGDDSSYYFTAQSVDKCDRKAVDFTQFDYHKNMVVDLSFNPCDSTIILNWNGYYYFQDQSPVEYEVERIGWNIYNVEIPAGSGQFFNILAFDEFVSVGTTMDSTLSDKVTNDKETYFYRVIARPTGSGSVQAFSSWDSLTTDFGAVPKFNYFTYATVRPTKEVALQFFKDTTVVVGGYTVYRGEDTLNMQAVNRLGPNLNRSLVDFEDLGANTDESNYFYQIIVENQCGNAVDTTNFASTIHLTVEPRNEALTNVLTWNEYQGWDSAVSFYNIYRGVNGYPATDLYATVPAGDKTLNQFVDNVIDNSYVKGDYCYKVEAVQGSVNPDYTPQVSPATSMSNEVCVIQKPLFYVPNAFAPDGINKIFGPEGQFFDFTKYEMIIYNRWGESIYETRDINEGWNGTVDGEIAPLGSYVYTIRFVDAEGKEHRRKGTVTLIK